MSVSVKEMTPYAQSQIQSARNFALIGFIFFAIMAAIWALVVTAVGVQILTTINYGGRPAQSVVSPLILPYGVFLGLSVAFSFWAWGTMRDIDAGHHSKAESNSLIVGIFGLFPPIGAIVGGVFLLLVNSKLSSAIRYAETPPPVYAAAPTAGRICPDCGRPVLMDAKFCQHCGHELPE